MSNLKKLKNFQIDKIILAALKEDISSEDITTAAIYRENKKAEISLIAKEDGILAGIDVFKRTFELLNEGVEFIDYKIDGDRLVNGDIILKIRGDVACILAAERTALNFLQRMSGIATKTDKMVKTLGDENIKILDTRKTTPNLRIFEKYSVKIGGGFNHRYNLSDGFLIKDNHIDAAGSVANAILAVRNYMPFIKKIEIETENLEMVKEALKCGADIIMLDNMDIETTKEAVKLINKKAIIEASGNIEIDNISRYRGSGVDYISSGSLTNSVKALDISLKNLTYLDN